MWKKLGIAAMASVALAAGGAPRAEATTSYTVTVVKIECLIKQDSWVNGKDEPEVTVNAMPIWDGSGFEAGTVKYLPYNETIIYTDAGISMWELDNNPDPDDYLGYFNFTSADVVGQGNQTHNIGGPDGKYKVTYHVDYR
jgi:hypothetical protein